MSMVDSGPNQYDSIYVLMIALVNEKVLCNQPPQTRFGALAMTAVGSVGSGGGVTA
jgi:hypothetical protein